MKAKSPAAAWFATLVDGNKKSFAAVRAAFELRWPVKAMTVKTTAEKQALLDETILKVGDLGRRVAACVGAEEELTQVDTLTITHTVQCTQKQTPNNER